uniref:Protein transport protein Sec31A n=1 Tax=Salarias fasciatus TaxID=181472 RepID=A0A672I4I8_SALFA
MKLKEINRTAIQSWSPSQHHPVYLATGTSAQQLDASFNTQASLEFFLLDLSDPSLEMKSCCSFSSPHRYHKLVWGPHGMEGGGTASGVLIAGGENGNVILYDAAKILEGRSDVVIVNLVASGGNESEIYIWDMNNFGSPMTPGPKTQPPEDISCVSWNRQVQHILASASPGGRASVWDLRKNDLIIKVSDHSNRMRCSGLAWNPEVATQLVVASEDDRMPVIQMWDLRFATSPLKILEHHTRGVLSVAWSLADPELLLSCGKDNRILCWNPGTAEVLYELPTSSQWCFDIQWCPRNPAVLSVAGFDGHIDLYSIMGGSSLAQSQRHADQISTSFGNLDPFGTGQSLPPLQLPQAAAPPAAAGPLKKPPKWIRRPVGASFGFGGRLVSFGGSAPDPQRPADRVAHVSQVVTETAFLRRSDRLQETLSSGAFVDFCQDKIQSAENQFQKTVWSFLKANFESDVRSRYLELLGYNREELALKELLGRDGARWTVRLSNMRTSRSGLRALCFPDVDGLITQALLTGDFEGAVELCLHDNRMADSLILAFAGGAELLKKTQKKYFTKTHSKITKLISAVVMKDWHDVLKTCDLHNWKEALAAVMTYAQPEEFSSLCGLAGPGLQSQACLCYICAGNVEKLVSCWSRSQDGHSPLSLQDLVEKVVVLRRAVELTQNSGPTAIGVLLAEKMSHYASLLASQGSLSTAIAYLPDNTDQVRDPGLEPGTECPSHKDPFDFLCASPAYSHLPPGAAAGAGPGGAPLYQPLHFSSSAPLPPAPVEPSSPPPPPPGFLSHYTSQPAPPLYPGQPPALSQCPTSPPPSHPPFFYPSCSSSSSSSSFPAPPSSGASFQHGGPGSPVSYLPSPPAAGGVSGTQMPPSCPRGPQNGWNDPPALTRAPKKKQVPQNYAPPAPITAPIMTPLGGDPQQQVAPPGVQGPPGAQVPYSGLQQQPLSPPPLNPAAPKSATEGPPGAPTGDVIQPPRNVPAEKMAKKPIPDEHLVLKTTFEGLIHKCLAVASDPQTKRKLDDANKRLEALYDKLREQTLSPAIVGGLHNMARSVEARRYTDGLSIHTHIVSSSNFSETSAFMPVLKVVLTQANKLGV